MPHIFVMKGCPGSGKSTWAHNRMLVSSGMIKRISNDDLRSCLDFGVWSKENELHIKHVREMLLKDLISRQYDIIIDNVHAGTQHFDRYLKIVEEANEDYVIEEVPIYCDLETAKQRDSLRPTPVGPDVVTKWWKALGKESFADYVPRKVVFQKKDYRIEQNKNLPRAVICDLDGSLALIGNRNPYDASTSDQDEVNVPVSKAVYAAWLAGAHVIFMSGRPRKYEEPTRKFIAKCFLDLDIQYDLYMRANDDYRKDADVKEELFKAHVLPKYRVDYVIDDRNSVVRRWRQLGLTCLQVAEGDF